MLRRWRLRGSTFVPLARLPRLRRGTRGSARCSLGCGSSFRVCLVRLAASWLVLRDGERVAVRVEEPGYLCAAGSGPDSVGALFGVCGAGELQALAAEFRHS